MCARRYNAAVDARSTITEILRRSDRPSDIGAELLPVIYDELRRTALGLLRRERAGHTLNPTDLVHEAYMRLFNQDELKWEDRRHFFGSAAIAMRRILVEHARRRSAGKRIPSDKLTPLELGEQVPELPQDHKLLALDEALTRLAQLDERQAQVVELRYFGGLTEAQVAEVLDVSRKTVTRDWQVARSWLARELAGR